ncbi:MAG: hypothetical protein ACLUOF_12660 [Ruminococcus sp.]
MDYDLLAEEVTDELPNKLTADACDTHTFFLVMIYVDAIPPTLWRW